LWPGRTASATPAQLDDLLLWCTLGVVLGGRLGYVLFYNPAYFVANPGQILQLWNGGMSFHGGFLGVVVACLFYGRRHGIGLDELLDLGAASVPIGLGLGRLANFVNGELYGRVTDVPWGVVFPGAGPEPRHPSQLYEALLEGLLLFLAVRVATHVFKVLPRAGAASGVFAIGYGLSRIIVDFVREPDGHIGYLLGGWLTMGMVLSLPLIAIGVWLSMRARRAV
jgi:phosphatidylglycerol:prolipoprotein diacylglycerol transferase